MSDLLQGGYLALPANAQPAPAVMVIHAWWGLNAFFKQFCDRLAQAGFVVFAPDLYEGKVAETIEQAAEYRDQTDWKKTFAYLHSAVAALRQHPQVANQPIGVMGFSLGAFVAVALLDEMPNDVRSAVIFYGIGEGNFGEPGAAVLGHFAEQDDYEDQTEINKFEQALKAAGVDVTFHTYPGTGHWFFESDVPSAYNADAAQLAWERTLSFLKARLATS